MKKTKISKDKKPELPVNRTLAGYAGQDFAQGRGGAQGGHHITPGENFHQFDNSGTGGFAAEPTPNTKEPEDHR